MKIFNSLGSNYNFKYISTALSLIPSGNEERKLVDFLREKYSGEPVLFYKGREAISYALELMNLPEGSEIAINGFTCVAVFNAIRSGGYEPVCLDLEDGNGLNFTPLELEKAIKRNKKIKAVIVQNTLGYVCDVKKIKKICADNSLVLIEDLAHSVGAKYEDRSEAGTVGDFVILSFSQDKIIDAVSGGALIVRNKKYKLSGLKHKKTGIKLSVKDRFYPYITYKIRNLYAIGLGKYYHYAVKKMNLMSDIMNESYYDYYDLPRWNAAMTLYMYNNLAEQLNHRRKVANLYADLLDEDLLMFERDKIKNEVNQSANLRFPIFTEDRDELINLLKKSGVYLADVWYREVAPECKKAVSVSNIVLNLPTHINVSKSDAEKISTIINTWKQKK